MKIKILDTIYVSLCIVSVILVFDTRVSLEEGLKRDLKIICCMKIEAKNVYIARDTCGGVSLSRAHTNTIYILYVDYLRKEKIKKTHQGIGYRAPRS